jgi:hypothetical protein
MSIWLAKLMGPIILLLALSMMWNPRALLEISREFITDRPLILISGVLATLAGLSIVNLHNVWLWSWQVAITLFGWALLIGGSLRILTPGMVGRIGKEMLRWDGVTRWAGCLWAGVGLFLIYHGYF